MALEDDHGFIFKIFGNNYKLVLNHIIWISEGLFFSKEICKLALTSNVSLLNEEEPVKLQSEFCLLHLLVVVFPEDLDKFGSGSE